MKKLVLFLMILVNIVVLASCGNTNAGNNNNNNKPSDNQNQPSEPTAHKHKYDEVDFDAEYHWSVCSCGETKDKEEHTVVENASHQASVCTECNAVYTEDKVYKNIKSIGVDPSQPHNAYQVLLYSFFDADGDGFGDFAGLEQKLDYIKDLGIDVMWLSPIMESESYHAYDITSFYRVDPKLGTIDDYLSLVDAAHSMDIKIVLDMPINHTSPNHEWFQAFLNGDPDYAEYYQEKQPGVNYGTSGSMNTAKFYESNGKTYFAAFGPTMPDLNYQSEELIAGIYEVFEYWMSLGTDGFRFDAVKHIFDPNEIPSNQNSIELNNELFQELGAHLKGINENVYLLGENFSGQTEVKQYAESFDAEFDFELWHISRGAVCGFDPWWKDNPDCRTVRRSEWAKMVVNCTNELIDINSDWIPTFMTGNHDVDRAASWICDRVEDDQEALKLYAAMCTLRQGIPFIYYGDEIGMYGENKTEQESYILKYVFDSEVRLPMTFSDSTVDISQIFTSMMDNGKYQYENIYADWANFATDNPQVDDQIDDEDSLLNTYKAILAYRLENPVIALGTMERVKDYKSQGTILKFTYEGETQYVAFNFGETALNIAGLSLDGELNIEFVVNGAETDGTDLYLEARGVAVFTCDGELSVANPTGVVTLYFSNNKKWSNVYAYVWNSSDLSVEAQWPGIQMKYVKDNEYGEKVYSIEVDLGSYDMIIFHNNNGWQSNDTSIDGVDDSTGFYMNNDNSLGTYAFVG